MGAERPYRCLPTCRLPYSMPVIPDFDDKFIQNLLSVQMYDMPRHVPTICTKAYCVSINNFLIRDNS